MGVFELRKQPILATLSLAYLTTGESFSPRYISFARCSGLKENLYILILRKWGLPYQQLQLQLLFPFPFLLRATASQRALIIVSIRSEILLRFLSWLCSCSSFRQAFRVQNSLSFSLQRIYLPGLFSYSFKTRRKRMRMDKSTLTN